MTRLIFLYLFVGVLNSSAKDVSLYERNLRANFIQRLLTTNRELEGRIKLVGGSTPYDGNVYVFHAGRWGAVCDDSWDDAAAQVVCSSFNMTGTVTHGSFYGETEEKYWMDDVVCEGNEATLDKCTFSGWGASDCEKTEVAGVRCVNKTEMVADVERKQKIMKLHEVIDVDKARFRLVGGMNPNEGRIEINNDGEWGSFCPDGFTLYEASVVCRHLGLNFARQAMQTDIFGSSKIVLSGLECHGNESRLFDCNHKMYGDVICPNDAGHVAAVVCTDKLADLALDGDAIEKTAHLQDALMFSLQCAMEENCLTKSAYEIQKTDPNWYYDTRRLLRFTASSLNIGNEDFRPYLPKHLWQWHLCHMHYHSMEVFATFDILDASGTRVAEGHKASFCLEDNTCLPGVEKKYSCKDYGDQGISVNCSDVYQFNLDCQWVDVTDVEPGDYTFKVAVNPDARIAEQSYDNNAVLCNLRLTYTYAYVYGCNSRRP